MIEKIIDEYKRKLTSGDVNELLKAPIYCMIINYLETENIGKKYSEFLSKKDNLLDYLYEVFIKTRRTSYKDVKDSLDFDQLSYNEKSFAL